MSYLEISIARTIARCGGRKGIILLIDYLQDVHAILSDHALDELKKISKKDFGKEKDKWRNWLKKQKKLPVRPFSSEKFVL